MLDNYLNQRLADYMRNAFYLMIFIIIPFFSLAQQPINLKGKVLDKTTQEGLPYAHVYLKSTSLGTNTSQDGSFHLNLPFLRKNLDTLIVSFLGYQTLKLPLEQINNRFDLVIRLSPSSEILDTVMIKEDYTVIDLIEEAIQAIPDNYYEKKPIYLKAYHTERVHSVLQNGFVREVEAFLTTFRPKMHGRLMPQVSVDKARKKITPTYNDYKLVATNAIIGLLEKGDIHKVLMRKRLRDKEYHYQMQGLRKLGERTAYYVTVEKEQIDKEEKRYFGEIYIDTATLAFVRINEQIILKSDNHTIDAGNAVFKNIYRVPRYQSQFDYTYNEDTGKWYFRAYDVHYLFIEKSSKSPDTLQLYARYEMQAIERENVKQPNPLRCLSNQASAFGRHIQDFATLWRDPEW